MSRGRPARGIIKTAARGGSKTTCSRHLTPLFDPAEKAALLRKAARFLRRRAAIDGQFVLVGTGLSGALFVSPLADRTGLPYCIVRRGVIGLRARRIEGGWPPGGYVIVDDFIVLGGTVSRVVREMKARDARSRLIGIMLYSPAYAEDYPRLAGRFACWIKNVGCGTRIVFPRAAEG